MGHKKGGRKKKNVVVSPQGTNPQSSYQQPHASSSPRKLSFADVVLPTVTRGNLPSPPALIVQQLYREEKKFDAAIQYVVQGMKGRFEYGLTSLSSSIDSNRMIPISLVRFPEAAQAYNYFNNLIDCSGDKIVEGYFVHDQTTAGAKVVVERFEDDLKTTLESQYSSWLQKRRPIKEWWRHICDKFISVFRDIFLALRHIFGLGCFCGILGDSVSVINGGGSKLMGMTNARSSEAFKAGTKKDLLDLRNLMLSWMLRPYCGWRNMDMEQLASCFAQQRIPGDIWSLIRHLFQDSYVEKVDLNWLLDDPAFWDPVQKTTFIRKLWYWLSKPKRFGIYLIDSYVVDEVGDWKSVVGKGSRAQQILDTIEEDKKAYSESKVNNGASEDNGSPGTELTRLYRHMLEHYNTKLKESEMMDMDEVSLLVDGMWGGTCSLLRCAVEYRWSCLAVAWQEAIPAEMKFFLSNRAF